MDAAPRMVTWIDTAEDAIAAARQRGDAGFRVFDRKAWCDMTPEQRGAIGAIGAAGLGAVVLGVRYRHSSAPWLLVTCESLSPAADRWSLWDMRAAPPSPLAVGVPRLDLAQKLGNVAAHSRAVRLVLGASMVGVATVAALASVWWRERA